ncbi:MAG TPA: hypothetical protein VFE37_18325 [Chloroflexota bacterium]|nr:hypothetical protein [Chloroflexota bacterium]
MEEQDSTAAATMRAVNIVAAEEHTDHTAALLMLAVVAAFKVGLTVWVVLAFRSSQNFIMNLALNWPWFILLVGLVGALIATPVLFWTRRVRVRAKRARLQHAEWHVD